MITILHLQIFCFSLYHGSLHAHTTVYSWNCIECIKIIIIIVKWQQRWEQCNTHIGLICLWHSCASLNVWLYSTLQICIKTTEIHYSILQTTLHELYKFVLIIEGLVDNCPKDNGETIVSQWQHHFTIIGQSVTDKKAVVIYCKGKCV